MGGWLGSWVGAACQCVGGWVYTYTGPAVRGTPVRQRLNASRRLTVDKCLGLYRQIFAAKARLVDIAAVGAGRINVFRIAGPVAQQPLLFRRHSKIVLV